MDKVNEIQFRFSKNGGSLLNVEDIQNWAIQLGVTIHIAIMSEPYLSKVMSGEKYIESRLSRRRTLPFQRAAAGDIVLLKRSSGPIVGVTSVKRVQFESVDTFESLAKIVTARSKGLAYEPGFLRTKSETKYIALMWLNRPKKLPNTMLSKRGQQAWLVLPGASVTAPPPRSYT